MKQKLTSIRSRPPILSTLTVNYIIRSEIVASILCEDDSSTISDMVIDMLTRSARAQRG